MIEVEASVEDCGISGDSRRFDVSDGVSETWYEISFRINGLTVMETGKCKCAKDNVKTQNGESEEASEEEPNDLFEDLSAFCFFSTGAETVGTANLSS
ncbi:UNVERIFIED_CONTAM: hypothetical protein K2H54_025591 [Gekko kuhli]